MSYLLGKIHIGNVAQAFRKNLILAAVNPVGASFSTQAEEEVQTPENEATTVVAGDKYKKKDPKDRSLPIPVETSIRYLKSRAYNTTYGSEPVWTRYRRNYKGHFLPQKTRHSCVRGGKIANGSPCPICRDEYLVVDHKNVDLIKQFISPYNGSVIHYNVTGVCQRQHKNILVALIQCKDLGTIKFDVPFKEYDYSDWNKSSESQKQ